MKRKRKAIRKDDYLAAALACLLPQEQRDSLRAAKVPAQAVIRLFSPDHIGLHCFEAKDRDRWHNLTPCLRPAHKDKSRRDTAIAAKVKRLRRKNDLDAFWEKACRDDTALKAWAGGKRRMARQPRRKVPGKIFRPKARWANAKPRNASATVARAKWRPVAPKQLHPES